MMQRAYLCVILHVKHKKLPFVAILQHIKNSVEGFYPHPSYPLYHGGGMNLRVRPRVNPVKLICIIRFSHLL